MPDNKLERSMKWLLFQDRYKTVFVVVGIFVVVFELTEYRCHFYSPLAVRDVLEF